MLALGVADTRKDIFATSRTSMCGSCSHTTRSVERHWIRVRGSGDLAMVRTLLTEARKRYGEITGTAVSVGSNELARISGAT